MAKPSAGLLGGLFEITSVTAAMRAPPGIETTISPRYTPGSRDPGFAVTVMVAGLLVKLTPLGGEMLSQPVPSLVYEEAWNATPSILLV